jgi:hypothetical protein
MTFNGENSSVETPERPVIEAAGRDVDVVAAEHVVQGLLEFQNRGDVEAKGRRVARVLEALGQSAADAGAGAPPVVYSFKRFARWGLSIAAVIGLGTALVFLGLPGERTALAEMQQTIAAMKGAGERRYEIRMDRAGGQENSPAAIVDSSGDLLLIRHTPPWLRDKSSYAFAGRDAKGAWAIRNGKIIRGERSEDDWPPFITDGGEAFMLSSVGSQLDQLPDQFTFQRGGSAPIDGKSATAQYERISAARKTTAGPMPTRVELWIDPATHLVERVEYHWDSSSAGGGAGGAVDGGGKSGSHGPGPKGGGHRGGDGPPPDDDGDGPPPPPDGHGGPGHPPHDHGPDGPDGHGGPHGPPPDEDGMDGPPPPPDGMGDGGPRHGHDDHGGPGGPGGPGGHGGPGGGPGGHGGGPRMIVFQRIDAAPFPAGWFDPETHLDKP